MGQRRPGVMVAALTRPVCAGSPPDAQDGAVSAGAGEALVAAPSLGGCAGRCPVGRPLGEVAADRGERCRGDRQQLVSLGQDPDAGGDVDTSGV